MKTLRTFAAAAMAHMMVGPQAITNTFEDDEIGGFFGMSPGLFNRMMPVGHAAPRNQRLVTVGSHMERIGGKAVEVRRVQKRDFSKPYKKPQIDGIECDNSEVNTRQVRRAKLRALAKGRSVL